MKMAVARAVFMAASIVFSVSSDAKVATASHLVLKRQVGGSGQDAILGMTVDPSGNIINVECFALEATHPTKCVLRKYDSNGIVLWHRVLALSEGYQFNTMRTDKEGNIYAVLQLPIPPQNYYYDWFIVKYSPDGVLLLKRRLHLNSPYEFPHGLTVDNDGNIAIGMATPVNGPWTTFEGQKIRKYSPSGRLLWTRKVSDPELNLDPVEVAADQFGNFFVVGHDRQQYGNQQYAWISKFDNNGALLWHNALDVSSPDFLEMSYINVNSTTVDASGDILLSGWATAGTVPGRCRGTCGWIAKVRGDGTLMWSRTTPENSYAFSVASSPRGNVVVGGRIDVSYNQNGTLYYYYNRPWISAFESDGTPSWQWYWPLYSRLANGVASAGLSIDPLGDIVFGGTTDGPLAGTYRGGTSDGFFAKLKP